LHPEKIVPLDPMMNGQLTREEITAAREDPRKRLVLAKSAHAVPEAKNKTRPRYTPVSRAAKIARRDRAWTCAITRSSRRRDRQADRYDQGRPIQSIARARIGNITQTSSPVVDPVTLGLTSQLELDLAVTKAADRKQNAPPESKAPH